MSQEHKAPRSPGAAALPPELGSALRAARQQAPSVEQLARLRAGFGLPPAATDGSSSHATDRRWSTDEVRSPGASAFAGSRVARVLPVIMLLTAAVTAWLWHSSRARPDGPRPSVAPPVAVAPVTGSAAMTAPAMAPLPASNSVATRPVNATDGGARRGFVGRGAVGAPTHRPEIVGAGIDPVAELALLKRARAAARSAPRRALVLVAEHAMRFPDGTFAQEREVIAVDALLASNDLAAARARAASFMQRFPGSAHARRIRELLSEAVDSDTSAPKRRHQGQ